MEAHFGGENYESPNAEASLWEGRWVRPMQGTVVWVLSSKAVVFKLSNIIPESRGSVPSGRVHGVLGTPTWCLVVHMQPLAY